MDGLEAVELKLSEVITDNSAFRFDSQFFLKEYLQTLKMVKQHAYLELGKLVGEITDGKHGGVSFTENGVVFIKNENNHEGFIDFDCGNYISIAESEQTKRAELWPLDILLTTIGTIGVCSVVPNQFPRATINQNLVRISLTNSSSIFACVFLNGKYGRNQIYRLATGNVQPIINYPNIRKIVYPIFSEHFTKSVESIFDAAIADREKAKVDYSGAEQIILHALGLENWKPVNQSTATKNLSQSFAASGRLDAEYYQTKYDEILERLQTNPHGCVSLVDCFDQNRSLSKLKRLAYHYIEIGDVSVSTGQVTANYLETNELPPNARIEGRKDELVVSKVRPYRGAVAIVESDMQDLLISTAFTVLRETGRYKKEALQVLLRTDLYKELLMQPSVGTSYPVIRDEDVMALPIPDLPIAIQQQIADKVQSAQVARRQSQQFLELAKQTVERAIESSEAEALEWLEVQLRQVT